MTKIRIRVAGLLSEKNKVLLVCHEKEGKRIWLLPGGGVEFGETLSGALVREIFEETSLRVKVVRLLFVNETIAPDGSRHGLHFTFLVRRQKGKLRVKTDERLKFAEFVNWKLVGDLLLRPVLGKFLLAAYRKKFKEPPCFLGNIFI